MKPPEEIELLLIDDDDEFRESVARRFRRRGYQVTEAASGEQGLEAFTRRAFDVAIVDLVMPGISGLDLLKQVKSTDNQCELILLTGQGTIETAVEAIKYGAFDFLTKPFPLADLEIKIQKAIERRFLLRENQQLKAVLQRSQAPTEMVGTSPAMSEIFRLIQRAGPTDKAILIQGESGTGKELVARALHRASHRADKPLVVINCAALPETLLESELFGHEKGSFTGAVSSKQGLFELADGGTLFIDEIGEMSGSLQAKLLRVLEDGSLRRVGSLKECRVNVRLLAATNRRLADEVQAGRFREDLYYRINVMSLELPPLRQRTGDIRQLVQRFLGPHWAIEPAAMAAMEQYPWPGNIRQLINALDRAKILADDREIKLNNLPPEISGQSLSAPASPASAVLAAGDQLAAIERAHIVEVLRRERGNKARTARALGINRRSLYRLLEKYGIVPDGAASAPSTDGAPSL